MRMKEWVYEMEVVKATWEKKKKKTSDRYTDLPSQLLFRYTETNTGGTVKKSTTELTSSQNHSLSLAAINCRKKKKKSRMAFKMTIIASFPGIADILYRMTIASTYLLSHANGWWCKQLMSLFIHSLGMSGLRLHHWNAALA